MPGVYRRVERRVNVPGVDGARDGARIGMARLHLAHEPRRLGLARDQIAGGDPEVVGGDRPRRQNRVAVRGPRRGAGSADARTRAGRSPGRRAPRPPRRRTGRARRPRRAARARAPAGRAAARSSRSRGVLRLPRPALALGLEMRAEGAGRHEDDEARGRAAQQGLGVVGPAPGELDEPVADERRLADQQILGSGMARVPALSTAARAQRPTASRITPWVTPSSSG